VGVDDIGVVAAIGLEQIQSSLTLQHPQVS
jgi:hypothetical protein